MTSKEASHIVVSVFVGSVLVLSIGFLSGYQYAKVQKFRSSAARIEKSNADLMKALKTLPVAACGSI